MVRGDIIEPRDPNTPSREIFTQDRVSQITKNSDGLTLHAGLSHYQWLGLEELLTGASPHQPLSAEVGGKGKEEGPVVSTKARSSRQ